MPIITDLGIRAPCPDCGGALSNWEYRDPSRGEFGWLDRPKRAVGYRQVFRLYRCGGCGRGGIGTLEQRTGAIEQLEEFWPRSRPEAALPPLVPDGVRREFREAEVCANAGAWRAASAMVRSALEKALKANGYTSGNLASKIDAASDDGVITAARKRKAHDDIRVLGNEVVHDEWRAVTEEEVTSALHYAQRILEDLYDDRPTVEATLVAAKRLKTVAGGPAQP